LKKLTAEKCQSVIDGFKWMASEGPGMSIRDEYDLQAYQMALQLLEAQTVADVIAWNHPNEERSCSVQLRRFDLKAGQLFMLEQQESPTDTYRQIENDGGQKCWHKHD